MGEGGGGGGGLAHPDPNRKGGPGLENNNVSMPCGRQQLVFILYFFIFFNLFSISVCLLNSPIDPLQLRARSQISLASH